MHKLSILFIFTVLLLVLSSLVSPAALAQTGTTDEIPFSQLNLTESLLSGPFDGMSLRFSVPANWQLEEGALVKLHLSASFTPGSSQNGLSTIQSTGALLGVSFNNHFLTNIILDWTGDNIVEVPIPVEALVATRSDGRHVLDLFLDAGVDCQNLDQKTSVVVQESSNFILPHSLVPLSTDLTILPRPIFQPDAFLPSLATIVVPDVPTAAELQAALTVAAGFGRLTGGRLPITLVSVDGLVPDVRDNTNLIFVGQGGSFSSLLGGVELPAPLTGDGFSYPGAGADDGIIQISVSPWNSAQLLLVVGGNSDAGVVNAAQAVSTGALRTAGRPDLALVADVVSAVDFPNVAPDSTFAELGYEGQSISGIGLHSATFDFLIPYGQASTGAASLDLIFNSSALLDSDLSGLTVYLNNQVVGSARLSEDTTQTTLLNFSLPDYLLIPGSNRLEIEANLLPTSNCTDFRLNNLWVNINPESTLHIPLGDAVSSESLLADLVYYPFPFSNHPTLKSTAFVLAHEDPQGWNIAAFIAADLGRRTYGQLVELSVAYGDSVSEELRQTHDLLVIGKATQIGLVTDLNPSLPAPYAEGNNMATESGPGVLYRLPEGANVGYLQLITSPWSPSHTVLAVLGSTDQGLTWAGNALTIPELRGKISGNYVVVNGSQVVSTDTRLAVGTGNLSAQVIPTSEAQVNTQTETLPLVTVPPSEPVKQTWIVPVLIGSTILMVIVLLIGLTGSLRSRRR